MESLNSLQIPCIPTTSWPCETLGQLTVQTDMQQLVHTNRKRCFNAREHAGFRQIVALPIIDLRFVAYAWRGFPSPYGTRQL